MCGGWKKSSRGKTILRIPDMRHEASQGQQAKYGRWIGVILIFCYLFKSIVGGQLSESGTRHPTTPLEPTGAVFTGNGITLGLLPLTQLSGPKPRVQYFHFWYDILHTDAVEREFQWPSFLWRGGSREWRKRGLFGRLCCCLFSFARVFMAVQNAAPPWVGPWDWSEHGIQNK